MRGYKAFSKDLKYRDLQFEVGHTYEVEGKPIVGEKGFHFCKEIIQIYDFYHPCETTRVCEIEALGDVVTEDNILFCTNKIKIIREITDPLQRKANANSSNIGFANTGNCNIGNWNSGNYNTGNCNTGNINDGKFNTGDCNTGNYNSGRCNTGNWNSGSFNTDNFNTGSCNTGKRNTGNWNAGGFNTGEYNTGNRNSGNRNSGDWNSSNYNSGCFCTEEHKINMFDKQSDWSYMDWLNSSARAILQHCPQSETVLQWINRSNMTDEEKKENPTYKTTGGYLKIKQESRNRQEWWDHLPESAKNDVKSLPNFDAEKFFVCTGIKV